MRELCWSFSIDNRLDSDDVVDVSLVVLVLSCKVKGGVPEEFAQVPGISAEGFRHLTK